MTALCVHSVMNKMCHFRGLTLRWSNTAQHDIKRNICIRNRKSLTPFYSLTNCNLLKIIFVNCVYAKNVDMLWIEWWMLLIKPNPHFEFCPIQATWLIYMNMIFVTLHRVNVIYYNELLSVAVFRVSICVCLCLCLPLLTLYQNRK